MDIKKQMLDQFVSTDRLIARFKEQDHKMLTVGKLLELREIIDDELAKRGIKENRS